MGGLHCFETLPFDAGDQPFPGLRTECADGISGFWPMEHPAMQAALAKPDAGGIPDQQFETGTLPVGEGVGVAAHPKLPRSAR